MLTNLSKLEKLKIEAYSDVDRSKKVDTFEAMFNPQTISQKFEIVYGKGRGINNSGEEVDYSRSEPSDLNLTLTLDGTGVTEFGIVKIGTPKTVSERIKEFLDLTYHMNGDIHEPNYLIVKWGDLDFSCRLGSVDISYTSFNRDGTALRAELVIVLISDQSVAKRMKIENKTSPDLTHTRVVKSGDTLPLLSKQIYGSSEHYLFVAEANGLDDFRNLTPGQEISFPPLEASTVET